MISTLNSGPAIRDYLSSANNYSEQELERMKLCGLLFERKSNGNQKLVKEFLRREPCLYNQVVYKNAARIFHCLKADLNENPILKTLKKQQAIEKGEDADQKQVTEVPKIEYQNGKEKKSTLQLAFSTLKFQKVLEDLLDECQFYGNYSQFKDEQSLVCTVLFDYMTRKFELRDKLIEEPFDNQDKLVTEIENAIHKEKTDLAAELAKNRIRADASTIEELLPQELREVEQHRAELPLYCWVNQIKVSVVDMIEKLVHTDELTIVDNKKFLEKKCFMLDPHCSNLLMFHFALRDKILNSEYVKNWELIVQDKSSCLAPYSVSKLLSKKDDVIIANLSGGLVGAFIGSFMEEYDGRVYVFGATNESRYHEISEKLHQIGVSKYVKLVKEDFMDLKSDDPKLENAKVILINAPCSKSALMNPMEFLFQEGEDVRFLRDYTIDVNNSKKIKHCIQNETALLKHALKFPKIRALVYQTYSKHSLENEDLIHRVLMEFNESRKSISFPYKLSPPVIALTADDIQNDEVVKNHKFLQFIPSNRMNGSFIGLLTRDRDNEMSKEMRRAEGSLSAKKVKKAQPATFEEKNFLKPLSPKKLTRRKTTGPKKLSASEKFTSLEEEIKQLQIRNKLDLPMRSINPILGDAKSKTLSTKSKSSINLPGNFDLNFDLNSKLSLIGRLDSKNNIVNHMLPKRSSTPEPELDKKNANKLKKIKPKKNFIKINKERSFKSKQITTSRPVFRYQHTSPKQVRLKSDPDNSALFAPTPNNSEYQTVNEQIISSYFLNSKLKAQIKPVNYSFKEIKFEMHPGKIVRPLNQSIQHRMNSKHQYYVYGSKEINVQNRTKY